MSVINLEIKLKLTIWFYLLKILVCAKSKALVNKLIGRKIIVIITGKSKNYIQFEGI